MTSDPSLFPNRLTKIDELSCGDHHYLGSVDSCFFLGEYSARQGFAHSETNKLIINFKKPMDRQGTPQWKWKGHAIRQASIALSKAIGHSDLSRYTFVPVPPSRSRQDALYDDRMMQMLSNFSTLVQNLGGPVPSITELVEQAATMEAAHLAGSRPSPQQLASNYLGKL